MGAIVAIVTATMNAVQISGMESPPPNASTGALYGRGCGRAECRLSVGSTRCASGRERGGDSRYRCVLVVADSYGSDAEESALSARMNGRTGNPAQPTPEDELVWRRCHARRSLLRTAGGSLTSRHLSRCRRPGRRNPFGLCNAPETKTHVYARWRTPFVELGV